MYTNIMHLRIKIKINITTSSVGLVSLKYSLILNEYFIILIGTNYTYVIL